MAWTAELLYFSARVFPEVFVKSNYSIGDGCCNENILTHLKMVENRICVVDKRVLRGHTGILAIKIGYTSFNYNLILLVLHVHIS